MRPRKKKCSHGRTRTETREAAHTHILFARSKVIAMNEYLFSSFSMGLAACSLHLDVEFPALFGRAVTASQLALCNALYSEGTPHNALHLPVFGPIYLLMTARGAYKSIMRRGRFDGALIALVATKLVCMFFILAPNATPLMAVRDLLESYTRRVNLSSHFQGKGTVQNMSMHANVHLFMWCINLAGLGLNMLAEYASASSVQGSRKAE